MRKLFRNGDRYLVSYRAHPKTEKWGICCTMFSRIRNLATNRTLTLFLQYNIYASAAAVVDMVLLYSLTEFLHIWYFSSAALATTCGMVVNYSMNKYLNFKNPSTHIAPQFGVFLFVAGIGWLLNQGILFFLVEWGKLWYMHAKLIAVCIVVFWSFSGHKHLTFSLFQ